MTADRGEQDDVQHVENVIVTNGGHLVGTDAPELLQAQQTLEPVVLDGQRLRRR
jgi:hypothetical protein